MLIKVAKHVNQRGSKNEEDRLKFSCANIVFIMFVNSLKLLHVLKHSYLMPLWSFPRL